MDYFHIEVIHNDDGYHADVYYVHQNGKSLTQDEKEAGRFMDDEAVSLQWEWIHRVFPGGIYSHDELIKIRQELQELRRKVGLDTEKVDAVKVIYANPECNYCAQPGCYHCGHIFP